MQIVVFLQVLLLCAMDSSRHLSYDCLVAFYCSPQAAVCVSALMAVITEAVVLLLQRRGGKEAVTEGGLQWDPSVLGRGH